jgi:hypothetical protein
MRSAGRLLIENREMGGREVTENVQKGFTKRRMTKLVEEKGYGTNKGIEDGGQRFLGEEQVSSDVPGGRVLGKRCPSMSRPTLSIIQYQDESMHGVRVSMNRGCLDDEPKRVKDDGKV